MAERDPKVEAARVRLAGVAKALSQSSVSTRPMKLRR